MITYVIGDIFRSPAKVLVNTVNTKGVMGKGLAKDFKALYPEMFTAYQRLCEERKFDVGQLYLFKTPNKWILNFPTKRDWKHPSKPEYIASGLSAFVKGYAKKNITSVAFPQLGCGHGELNWENDVQPLMEKYLSTIPIQVYIHLYRKDVFPKEHHDLAGMKNWLHREPESLGFHQVWDDLTEMITRSPEFSTDRQEDFRITPVHSPEEGLEFKGISNLVVPKETLLDLWQYFRSVGFLAHDSMPEGLAPYADKLMSLFGRLPYVSHVQIARGRASAQGKFVDALQLTPRAAPEEPLFQTRSEAVVHA